MKTLNAKHRTRHISILTLNFIAALISIRLKVPYTLILVLTGVLITVIIALLSLQGSPNSDMVEFIKEYTQIVKREETKRLRLFVWLAG